MSGEQEKEWSWEDEELEHEEGDNVAQESDQESTEQPVEPTTVEKKTRKVTVRTSSKITPEILLSKPCGFKYVRKNFERLKGSLQMRPESVLSDTKRIIEFYDEWFHYLQPRYKTLDVARDVEKVCHTGRLSGYFAKLKGLHAAGGLGDFDEELEYGEQLQQPPPVEPEESVAFTEEMRQQVEQNKFEAQQRLLAKLQRT